MPERQAEEFCHSELQNTMTENLQQHIDNFERISKSHAESTIDGYRQAIFPHLYECLVDFEGIFLRMGPDPAIKVCLVILREYLPVFLSRHPRYLHYVKALKGIEERILHPDPNYRVSMLRRIPDDPAAMAYYSAIREIMTMQERLVDPDQITHALDAEYLRHFEPWHKYCKSFIDIMLTAWSKEARGNTQASGYDEDSIKLFRNRKSHEATVSKLRDYMRLLT